MFLLIAMAEVPWPVMSFRPSVHSKGRDSSASQSTSLPGVPAFDWGPPRWGSPGHHHSFSTSGHCCGQKTALLRSVWGAHILPVPRRQRELQSIYVIWGQMWKLVWEISQIIWELELALGCLSVMSPKHSKAISISCTSFISHSSTSLVPR